MSAALTLLRHVWNRGKKDSWGRINHSMRNALSLAIGSGLSFKATDFSVFAQNFRWGYWVTDNAEWIYHMAIINGNESCIKAWEEHKGREPFRGNDVNLYRWEGAETVGWGNYIHSNQPQRQRERLAEGFGLPLEGRQWWVTGFDDEAGKIRLVSYEGHWPDGKPKKRRTLTHEELATLCPAPKKKKAETKPEETI